MHNIKFNQLTDDARILSIGDFFRKDSESIWRINLDFYPKQNKSFLELSNAPVLVKKRTLNPTNETNPSSFAITFSIVDTKMWSVKTLSEYPLSDKIRKIEKEQFCFFFEIDSGLSIYLPQLELARVLFLHNAYLSRTALEPNGLRTEFDVISDKVSGKARVNVLPSSGYPLKSLDDYQSRRLLSWILIDKEARRSFESISESQVLHGTNKNGYRHWNFQFEPPSLCSVAFTVRGWNDKASKAFFVYEVIAIQNLKADIPDTVEFYHPEFKETKGAKGAGGGGSSKGKLIDEYEIQEGESANSDQPHSIIQALPVQFTFANPFKTVKVAKKEQKRASRQATEKDESLGVTPKEVSIEEPIRTGQHESADWNLISDDTEDAHIYANKFYCFHQMLDQLVSQHGCVIKSKQIRKLPRLARCKKHLLTTDGNPRCIAVIEISVDNKTFHILEVDTSDAVNSLSTQILILNATTWNKQLIEIERALIKKSLVWPNNLFVQYCGVGNFKGAIHPKSSVTGMGLLDSDSIARWADRFYRLMNIM